MKYTLTLQGRDYSPFVKRNVRRYINLHNLVVKFLSLSYFTRKIYKESSSLELNEIRNKSLENSDISDHLETMFIESISVRPKLIVELGVRTGQSTFVFERVAKMSDAFLISVDIASQLVSSKWHKWSFVQEDDTLFADRFVTWCTKKGIDPKIDILFIDTSHEYNHTKREIAKWFPLLSEKAKVFFHDANVKLIYRRRNFTIGKAYNDDKDVMRAIEEYLCKKYDQTKDFVDINNSWLIKHFAICNGMTILQKVCK